MAHNYEKIYAPFGRDSSKSEYVNTSKWSKPEFEFLQNNEWIWTQKIDGSNLNIIWDGERVSYKGHTDKTQWNERSKNYIESVFCTTEAETVFEQLYGEQPVIVSMEIVSKDFNQNYGHLDGHFYVYDVRNGVTGKYWDRKAVEDFVQAFDPEYKEIEAVQIIFKGTIKEAIEWVKIAREYNENFERKSVYISNIVGFVDVKNPLGKYPIEGLVGRPLVEIYNSKGERIITKVKCKDYE